MDSRKEGPRKTKRMNKMSFHFSVMVSAVLAALGMGLAAQAQTTSTPSWLRNLGDGSETDYSCTAGACPLSTAHSFSSFNVSAGATVVAPASGSPIVVRSTGPCTVAGTISNSVNTAGGGGNLGNGDFGGGGGGGGAGKTRGQNGLSTVGDAGIPIINGGTPGAAGPGGNAASPAPNQYRMLLSGGSFWPAGGSAGGAAGGPGSAGGAGGGAVILICNSISFTGTIDVSGGPGVGSTADDVGASGGGGAGYVVFSALSYPANSGTINTSGGAGGSCNGHKLCGAGGNGGSGWNVAITIQ
jgi:hypothetical protein